MSAATGAVVWGCVEGVWGSERLVEEAAFLACDFARLERAPGVSVGK